MTPPSTPRLPRETLRELAAWLGLALVAVLWRLWLRSGLELSGWPGAAGGQRITQAARGNFSQTFDGWTVGVVTGLLGGDPARALDAIYLGSLLGGLAMVLGAALAGRALAGPRAGLATGALVAVWAPCVWISLLTGADATSVGLAWLGVGLSWWSARRGVWGLPGVLLGALAVSLGLAVKANAMPVLAYLALAPLFAPGLLSGLAHAAVLGLSMLWARGRLVGTPDQDSDLSGSAPSLEAWLEGLEVLQRLPESGLGYASFPELAVLALVALLLPTRRPGLRLLVVLLPLTVGPLMAGLRFAAARPRVLLPASLGLVLGAGVLLGRGADLLAASRRLRELRWLPLGVFAGVLALDGVGFLHAWSESRESFAGTEAAGLPAPPSPFTRRHVRFSRDINRNTTHVGSAFVPLLPSLAPPEGVGLVPLRDRREADHSAALELSGVPWRVFDPHRCCVDEEEAICAARVVGELDAGGGLLLLPSEGTDAGRVDRAQAEWVEHLRSAALETGQLEASGEHWMLMRGRGEGGVLPCDPAAAGSYPGAPRGTPEPGDTPPTGAP